MSKIIKILLALLLFIISQLPQFGLLVGSYRGFDLPMTVVVTLVYVAVTIGFLIFGQKYGLIKLDRTWFGKKAFFYLVFGYLALIVASAIGTYLLSMTGETNTNNQEIIEKVLSKTPQLIMFIQLVLLAPISEELICRGLIPTLFSEKNVLWGHVLGTICFAFLHVPTNVASFLLYFLMGVVLAFVRWHSKRIEYSINVHSLNNLVSFLLLTFLG
ncbi:CPBP family intramembrane glutamic endopeptidase [Streptococcus caprae]|uniref:CPBP family intramembrane glutamic endopeptidase n=1 Tax=Streptococcus caprae TaxID=1640501 RepID=A0ABV8CW76_9STRE